MLEERHYKLYTLLREIEVYEHIVNAQEKFIDISPTENIFSNRAKEFFAAHQEQDTSLMGRLSLGTLARRIDLIHDVLCFNMTNRQNLYKFIFKPRSEVLGEWKSFINELQTKITEIKFDLKNSFANNFNFPNNTCNASHFSISKIINDVEVKIGNNFNFAWHEFEKNYWYEKFTDHTLDSSTMDIVAFRVKMDKFYGF